MSFISLLFLCISFILTGSNSRASAATTADAAPNDTTADAAATSSKPAPRVVMTTFSSTPTSQTTTTTSATTTIKFPQLTTIKVVTLPAPPRYPSLPVGEKIFKYVRLTRKSLYGHLLVSWDIQDAYVTQEVNYSLITEYFRIGDCAVSKNLSSTKEEIPLQNLVRSYELQNVASWSSLAVTLRGTELTRGKTDYITETVVTHETVPTGKPLDIHPMSIQPNSAQLAWSPPVCEERGGLLVKYDVELTSGNAPNNVKPMTADREYIALSSLTAFTYYQIRVRYVNSVGTGPYSDHFVFQTGQGPPSAPIVYNFTFDDISIGVVIVSPVQPNGQIDQYNIELTGGISHLTDLYTPLNGTEYIIGNLMPNTTYLIRARARNAAGWGDWSKQIQVSTKSEIKPSPIALRQIMANKTCIGFQWAPPSTDLNLVHSYEIRVFSNDEGSLPIRTYVSKDSLEHVQCGLTPYTHYSVSVSVVKDTGQTGHPLGARMWTEGMTPPKPRPPVIRKETSTTVTVEVFPVLFDQGPITSYEIRMMRVYHNHSVRDPHPFGADVFGDDVPLWFLEDKAAKEEQKIPQVRHDNVQPPETARGHGSDVPNIVPIGKRSVNNAVDLGGEDGNMTLDLDETDRSVDHHDVFIFAVPDVTARRCELGSWFHEWRQRWRRNDHDGGGVDDGHTMNTPDTESGCIVSEALTRRDSLTHWAARAQRNVGFRGAHRRFDQGEAAKDRVKRSFGNPPGVLWLELTEKDIPEPGFWVIGDEQIYHGRRNLALEPDTEYAIFFAVKSTVVDITKHSYSLATTTAFTLSEEAEWLTYREKMILLYAIIPICVLLFCLFGFFVIRHLFLAAKDAKNAARNNQMISESHGEDNNYDESNNDLVDDEDSNDDYMPIQKKKPNEQSQASDKDTAKLEQFFNPTQNVGQPRFITTMRENILYNDSNRSGGNDGNNSAEPATRVFHFSSDCDGDSPDEQSFSYDPEPSPPAYAALDNVNNNKDSSATSVFGAKNCKDSPVKRTSCVITDLQYNEEDESPCTCTDNGSGPPFVYVDMDSRCYCTDGDVTLVDMSGGESDDSGMTCDADPSRSDSKRRQSSDLRNSRLGSSRQSSPPISTTRLLSSTAEVVSSPASALRNFCQKSLFDYLNNNNNSIVNSAVKYSNTLHKVDFGGSRRGGKKEGEIDYNDGVGLNAVSDSDNELDGAAAAPSEVHTTDSGSATHNRMYHTEVVIDMVFDTSHAGRDVLCSETTLMDADGCEVNGSKNIANVVMGEDAKRVSQENTFCSPQKEIESENVLETVAKNSNFNLDGECRDNRAKFTCAPPGLIKYSGNDVDAQSQCTLSDRSTFHYLVGCHGNEKSLPEIEGDDCISPDDCQNLTWDNYFDTIGKSDKLCGARENVDGVLNDLGSPHGVINNAHGDVGNHGNSFGMSHAILCSSNGRKCEERTVLTPEYVIYEHSNAGEAIPGRSKFAEFASLHIESSDAFNLSVSLGQAGVVSSCCNSRKLTPAIECRFDNRHPSESNHDIDLSDNSTNSDVSINEYFNYSHQYIYSSMNNSSEDVNGNSRYGDGRYDESEYSGASVNSPSDGLSETMSQPTEVEKIDIAGTYDGRPGYPSSAAAAEVLFSLDDGENHNNSCDAAETDSGVNEDNIGGATKTTTTTGTAAKGEEEEATIEVNCKRGKTNNVKGSKGQDKPDSNVSNVKSETAADVPSESQAKEKLSAKKPKTTRLRFPSLKSKKSTKNELRKIVKPDRPTTGENDHQSGDKTAKQTKPLHKLSAMLTGGRTKKNKSDASGTTHSVREPEKSDETATTGRNDATEHDTSSNNPRRGGRDSSDSDESESDTTESGESEESSSEESETESESESAEGDAGVERAKRQPSPYVAFTGGNEPVPQFPFPQNPPQAQDQATPKRKWYHKFPFFKKSAPPRSEQSAPPRSEQSAAGNETWAEPSPVKKSASDGNLRNGNTFQRSVQYQQPVQPLVIAQYPVVQAVVSPRMYSSVPHQMVILPPVTSVAPPRSPYSGPKRNVNWSKKNDAVSTRTRPASQNVSFRDEFASLENFKKVLLRKMSFNVAQRNLDRNRFPYLLAPDHSRVNIEIVAAGDADYYNGNYIRLESDIKFIAAQTPFSPITVSDFWRMVLQNRVETIVMLCACVEGGVIKSEQYWAETGVYAGGHVLVETVSQKWFSNFVIRTFQLSAACNDNVRVTQFQFFSWPLNGVPDDPIPFLELRYRVRGLYGNKSSPVLVICGTGVARSAVFIAVDQLIEEYGRDGCVNVYRFVKRMRRSRPFMVRNLNQYRFIYECLFEEFQAGDTVLRLDMKQQYRALCQKNPQSDFTFLMDQFRILCHFTPELTQKDCSVGSLKSNASKNVDQRMLPPDKYRPYSQINQGDPGSWPYINAVIFNGHRRADEFIVTQTPLINTAFDFWKMIYDYQVQTIVMFGKCRGHNQEQYFPKTGGRQFGNLYVEHVNTTKTDSVTTRNLKVCVMGLGGVEKRAVRHVKQWDDGDTLPVRRIDQFPNSMADVLDLMEKVLDWQVVANRRTKPMVVVCRNGATLSGLFVACAVVCEKMREDREVDLYHTVKHIKRRRPTIISDFDQYRFLHQVLWQYIVNYMPEVKKLIHFDELASSSGSDVESANGGLGNQFPHAHSPAHEAKRDRGGSFSRRYSPERKQDHTWMVDDDFSDTQQLLQMPRHHDDDDVNGDQHGRVQGRRAPSAGGLFSAQRECSVNQSAASSEHSQDTAESRTCTCLPVCRKKRKREKSLSSKSSRTTDDAEEDFHPRNLGSISRGLGGRTSGETGNSLDRSLDEKNFDWPSSRVNRGESKNQVSKRKKSAAYDERDAGARRRRGHGRRYSVDHKKEETRQSFDDMDKFDRDIFLPPSVSTPKMHIFRPRDMTDARELVDTATGSDTVLPPEDGFERHPEGPAERRASERLIDAEMEEMLRRLYSTRVNQPGGTYGGQDSPRNDIYMTRGQDTFVPRRPSSFTGRFRKAKSRQDFLNMTQQSESYLGPGEFSANKQARDEDWTFRGEPRDAPPRDVTRADLMNEPRDVTRADLRNETRDVTRADLRKETRDVTRVDLRNETRDVTRADLRKETRDVTRADLRNETRDVTRADLRNEPSQMTSDHRALPKPRPARQPSSSQRLFASEVFDDTLDDDDVFQTENPTYSRRSAPVVEGERRGNVTRDSVIVDRFGRAYEDGSEEPYGQYRQEVDMEETDHKPSTWPREVVRRFPSRRLTTPAPSVVREDNLVGDPYKPKTYTTRSNAGSVSFENAETSERATKKSPFKPKRRQMSAFESIPEEEDTLSEGSFKESRSPEHQLERREEFIYSRKPDEQPRDDARNWKSTGETASTDNMLRTSSPVKQRRGSAVPQDESDNGDAILSQKFSFRGGDMDGDLKTPGKGSERSRDRDAFSYTGKNGFAYEDEHPNEVATHISKRFSAGAEPSFSEGPALRNYGRLASGPGLVKEEDTGFQEKLRPRQDSYAESGDFRTARLSTADAAHNDGRVYLEEPRDRSRRPSAAEADLETTPYPSARRYSGAGRFCDTGHPLGAGASPRNSRGDVSDTRTGRDSQMMTIEDLDPVADEVIPLGSPRQSGDDQEMAYKLRPDTGRDYQARLSGQEPLSPFQKEPALRASSTRQSPEPALRSLRPMLSGHHHHPQLNTAHWTMPARGPRVTLPGCAGHRRAIPGMTSRTWSGRRLMTSATSPRPRDLAERRRRCPGFWLIAKMRHRRLTKEGEQMCVKRQTIKGWAIECYLLPLTQNLPATVVQISKRDRKQLNTDIWIPFNA